jgi:hypothetical protein
VSARRELSEQFIERKKVINLDLNSVRRYLDEVIVTENEDIIDVSFDHRQEPSFEQSQHNDAIHRREQRLHCDR